MSVIDDRPRTTWTPRMHRRHEIITTAGMSGVLRIGEALATCGYAVRDFIADVREGVPYSSVTCTVSLTGSEYDMFADRLMSVPSVVAVTPC